MEPTLHDEAAAAAVEVQVREGGSEEKHMERRRGGICCGARVHPIGLPGRRAACELRSAGLARKSASGSSGGDDPLRSSSPGLEAARRERVKFIQSPVARRAIDLVCSYSAMMPPPPPLSWSLAHWVNWAGGGAGFFAPSTCSSSWPETQRARLMSGRRARLSNECDARRAVRWIIWASSELTTLCAATAAARKCKCKPD